mmetsp:Transcript_23941/g.60604  ORF Transcript_23941/g.60604 Transcript_23941/m.60604 type:complete len:137 (+) Transcript_23941:257-667(+)
MESNKRWNQEQHCNGSSDLWEMLLSLWISSRLSNVTPPSSNTVLPLPLLSPVCFQAKQMIPGFLRCLGPASGACVCVYLWTLVENTRGEWRKGVVKVQCGSHSSHPIKGLGKMVGGIHRRVMSCRLHFGRESVEKE